LIEEAIERHIAGDGELDRLAKVLRAVRGVGPVVAATLIADLPELGRLSGKQIAALVGLAPTPTKAEKESGKPRAILGCGPTRLYELLTVNAIRSYKDGHIRRVFLYSQAYHGIKWRRVQGSTA
jgi:hypothetical protein